MNNFELIDDYLTNRLDEQARKAFEHQMNSDPALKADVELQSQIISGLQKARAAELKAMLNKVPIGAAPVVEFSVLKIAAGVVGAALVASALYLYLQKEPIKMPDISTSLEDSIKQQEKEKPQQEEITTTPEEKKEEKAEEKKGAESSKQENDKKAETQGATKPALDVVDPSEDLSESEGVTKTEDSKPAFTRSDLTVDVDSSNKKYASHYKFAKGKLILFGSFDKSLFEVLEINGDKRTVFLFHKNSYYLLDESKEAISPLEAIDDKVLLKKLNEYRNK